MVFGALKMKIKMGMKASLPGGQRDNNEICPHATAYFLRSS